MKQSFTLLIVFCSCLLVASPAGVLDEVAAAIRNGDARTLARYFDAQVDVTVLDDEDTYSKAQAELVVKDFFADHSPRSFDIVHVGNSSGGSQQYAIGTLVCSNGTFRVYVNLKESGSGFVIQEIRFEEE